MDLIVISLQCTDDLEVIKRKVRTERITALKKTMVSYLLNS